MAATKLKAVDAVVVGAGLSGTILCKSLAETGLKVVAIERGRMLDTQHDFAMPYVHDELKYDRHSDILQNLSRETLTFRNAPNETALPMRLHGSFKIGEVVGGAGVSSAPVITFSLSDGNNTAYATGNGRPNFYPTPGGKQTPSENGTFTPCTNAACTTLGAPLAFNNAGTALLPFQNGVGSNTFYSAVSGGEGRPAYQYTNLRSPVDRNVMSGTLTYKLTDTINLTADASWGKVETDPANPTRIVTIRGLGYMVPRE